MLGVDIVKIERVEKWKEHDGFLQRIFTPKELEYIKERHYRTETIAGIFASKEAVSKALGTGIGEASFKEMEIFHTESGKPVVELSGKTGEILRKLGMNHIELSIAHEKEFAVAVVDLRGVEVSITHEEDPAVSIAEIKQIKKLHIDKELCNSLLKRDKTGYKTQYGKVAIVGGSRGMAGAVCMACEAALRAGAGLVYAVVPKSIESVVQIKLTEAMVIGIEDDGTGKFSEKYVNEVIDAVKNCDCVAVGPGLGRTEEMTKWLEKVVSSIDCHVVLDADALFALSKKTSILKVDEFSSESFSNEIDKFIKKPKFILTPHEMEMSRISGIEINELRKNRENSALNFAKEYDCIVVLKGSGTIVTDGNKTYINRTGNPGMATAGSGDVLTGITAALVGFGYAPLLASKLAVYIHGLSGDIGKEEVGEDSLIATDIIKNLYRAFKFIKLNSEE